jgi:uncharacterized ferritin-like protein (DUF455 family)
MGSTVGALRPQALHCLQLENCDDKVAAVTQLRHAWQQGEMTLDVGEDLVPSGLIPGRPSRPQLVSPLTVKHRSMGTAEGRAALVHALTHIEFNAINLALDAIWRFKGMPVAFYEDWLRVAAEESYHFSLLSAHLQRLGFAYGDFDAHNSLWDMAEKTSGDVLARIALVPRVYEARGLDAVPQMRAKLVQAGDVAVGEIMDMIMRDEVGHVAIGNHWYHWLCQQRALAPIETFQALSLRYKAPTLRGPFNQQARRDAGFTEEEMLLFFS